MEIWENCKESGKSFSSYRGFLNHLRSLNMSSKEYYDKHHKKPFEGKCKGCENPTKYSNFKYNEFCGVKCSNSDEDFRELISKRFERNPSALESFRKKRKESNVDNNLEKRRKTIEEKAKSLGITVEEYHSIHGKKARNSLSQERIEEIKLKRMDTIQNTTGNYGGRSTYKKFDFFDETVSLQGYEPLVLRYLIESGLSKDQIRVGKSNIPIIRYEENSLYFPDFYLPDSNLIIEVKSDYTFKQHRDKNMSKAMACLKSGFSILILVVQKSEARKGKLESSKKLLDWAISSQAPKPTWYGEGSTTIPLGVESNDSKCSPTTNGW
jgi:hypothetical protein